LDSLWSRHQKAADEVQKIAVIGSFIVSDAVADDLVQLKKARAKAMQEFYSDEYGDPYETVEKEIKAIEDCIPRFRQHAKKDLGITRKLLPSMAAWTAIFQYGHSAPNESAQPPTANTTTPSPPST
jgi:hypothetical protein